MAQTPDTAAREFVVSRVLNAPRHLVFRAWTELEALRQWFGPKGFAMDSCTLDLRPGGVFHYCMRAPGGQEMWGKFVYREIVPEEQIVFVTSFSDAAGGTIRHPMSQEWPLEVLSTVTFEEHHGKTTLTMRGVPVNASEAERKVFEAGFDGMQAGWRGTLAQLEEHLSKGGAQ